MIHVSRPLWLLPAAALTLLLTSGCSEQQASATATVVHPAKVFQISPASQTMLRRFPAQVQAAERAALAFRVSGELLTLPAQAGKEVRQGDVLARLDPADYQLRVDDRKARYELAESQFQRVKDLFELGQISQSQFDQAKAELDISKAALASARTDLSYTTLKAPFSGVIAEVYADNHQPVAAGKTLVMLQAKDQLEVRLQIPENLMAHIAKKENTNYQPDVEFEALPGKRFRASYKEHTAQADPATGSFTITLTLPRPPSLNLLPGMSASVHVDLSQVLSQSSQNLIVPPQAVFQGEQQADGSSQAMVWIVTSDMTLQTRAVKIGQLSTSGLEITQGLQPGDTILAAGVHQAHEGMRIRPWIQERGL
ncbi:MAG: efflux transporter periplasmic adaptor subunit [Thalassolituus sp. CG17_big_fil_post_rev_8_21_14_2_50_53_8]|nr:MAG: efflux transporter periplasmic adaptor subunit [Thalassolituus sp. CG17_big_fil_post_rev_8_21_14_2_50_53_8]